MLNNSQSIAKSLVRTCLKQIRVKHSKTLINNSRNSSFLPFGGFGDILRLCYTTEAIQEAEKTASSVDVDNLELLQRHSKDWWDPVGSMKPLHTMNHLRVPFIRDGLISTGVVAKNAKFPGILEGLNILEVGCGGGILTEALARLKANVTAIDPSLELISVAQEHLQCNPELSQRINYLQETIEVHSVKNSEKYDAVILSEVIEHVNDQENFLKMCIGAVKSGGSVFLSTLNKTTLSYFLGIILAQDVLKLLPKNTHEWDKFISPTETQRILEKNNCSVIMVNGLLYCPLNNVWEWSNSTDVNYIQHAIKH
uniref:Ubiquinone biosynthesis O-methyltransferase, mitochondrial n=1 Tax=Lutzomyia longipalpis TaxID=7200 RepID=A0A1B0CUX1_LUTLO